MDKKLSYGTAKAVAPKQALAMGLTPDQLRPAELMRGVNSGAMQPVSSKHAVAQMGQAGTQSGSAPINRMNPQQTFQATQALQGGMMPQPDSRMEQRQVNNMMGPNAQVQPNSNSLDGALKAGLAGLGFLSLFNR